MPITPGTKVRTPTGRNGVVRNVGTIRTGKRGRPALTFAVQERDESGRFVKGTSTYGRTELSVA